MNHEAAPSCPFFSNYSYHAGKQSLEQMNKYKYKILIVRWSCLKVKSTRSILGLYKKNFDRGCCYVALRHFSLRYILRVRRRSIYLYKAISSLVFVFVTFFSSRYLTQYISSGLWGVFAKISKHRSQLRPDLVPTPSRLSPDSLLNSVS